MDDEKDLEKELENDIEEAIEDSDEMELEEEVERVIEEAKEDIDLEENTKEFRIPLVEEELEEEMEKKKNKKKKELSEEDKKSRKKKIIFISLIVIGVLLIAGALYYIFFHERPVKYTQYTLEKVSNDFLFEGIGVIVTDDVAKYSLDETDSIEFLVGTYPGEGDLVEIDDILFKYKERSLGDNIYKGVKPVNSGTVHDLTEESVTIRESISAHITVPSATYSPAVGTCAIMEITVGEHTTTVNGEVTQILYDFAEDYVTLELINPSYEFADGNTGDISFASSALSSAYDCYELYLTEEGKISDIGNHGASDPEYSSSGDLEISATTSIYTSDFPESENPGDDYELVSENGLQVELGEKVTTSSYLFKWTFVEINVENKTIKTLVRGEVKSVDLVKDDPDALTGTYEIQIYDLDKNYLTFDINSEYEDYISVGTPIVIKNDDIEITAEINTVENLVGSVANANFKNYNLDDEFSVTIEGTGEEVILIPKTCVLDGKVKRIVGEEIIEVQITYEEYNEDNYKLLTGLAEGEIIESYE